MIISNGLLPPYSSDSSFCFDQVFHKSFIHTLHTSHRIIDLFALISIKRITLSQLIVCQIYQKPIIRSSTMTTRTTMIEEACDDGNDFSHHEWLHVRGEGGHDLLSKKPLLFSSFDNLRGCKSHDFSFLCTKIAIPGQLP